jgi:hypothetical protein
MMTRTSARLFTSGFLAISLLVITGLPQAAQNLVPPNANAYGLGYDKLAANWTEWAMAIPLATNPILDPDGSYATLGQSGKVWFLAGTANGPAIRTVTVPTGTALFFPIVNYFWVNTPEFGDDPWSPLQEAYARNVLAYYIDMTEDLVLEVDGKLVPDVYGRLRVPSTVGICMFPEDNFYGGNPGAHECVADGFWALVPPLSAGSHVIHFSGRIEESGFALDVTYNITVKPR